MKAGIIGAGRAGCSLALALRHRGAEISGVYSGRSESAAQLEERLGMPFENDLRKTVGASDVIFIAVPDKFIEPLVLQIAGLAGREQIAGRVFLHLSGAAGSSALDVIREAGGFTGSLHPIQTFADRETSWEGMYGIYFGFEGMQEARGAAEEAVELLGGSLLEVSAEAKPLYHAAACVLSNYVAALSHMAGCLLEAAGIGRDTGMKAFGPLLRNTAENIISMGSAAALTGPISRGDTGTVAAHLKALDEMEKDGQWAGLYKALGRAAVSLALEKGSIDANKASALRDLLE